MSLKYELRVTRTPEGGAVGPWSENWKKTRVQAMQEIAKRMERGIRIAAIQRHKTHPTGDLAKSWRIKPIVVKGESILVSVASNLVYAGIQHRGGTILPKTVKRLAIPLRDDLRRQALWPRDFPRGTFWSTAKEGKGLLIHAETGEPWYVLLTSVHIPGTRYVTFGMQAARKFVREEVAQMMALAKKGI